MIATLAAATALLTCNQLADNFVTAFETNMSAVLLHTNGEGFTVLQQTETHVIFMHFAHPNFFKLYSSLFDKDKKGQSCTFGNKVFDTYVRIQQRKPPPAPGVKPDETIKGK